MKRTALGLIAMLGCAQQNIEQPVMTPVQIGDYTAMQYYAEQDTLKHPDWKRSTLLRCLVMQKNDEPVAVYARDTSGVECPNLSGDARDMKRRPLTDTKAWAMYEFNVYREPEQAAKVQAAFPELHW